MIGYEGYEAFSRSSLLRDLTISMVTNRLRQAMGAHPLRVENTIEKLRKAIS